VPESTKPTGRPTVTSSFPGSSLLLGAAVVVVVVVGLILVNRPGGIGGKPAASATPAAASPSPGGSVAVVGSAPAGCPTSQPEKLPAGETRTVTLKTPKGDMAIKVEADLSPIAAGNFVALASCGFYDGTVFHRTATLQDGTPFVIQGGGRDPGPGYTIQDEPVTATYKRGTVAMARSSQPNSVDSQFFIVLDDKDADVLKAYNTYQIIGNVTSGMETADAIYQASGGVESPANPIPITTATVANP
jgi:peptidyl-prolyl cis-trans isomerase B (cyclophilin B)